MVCIFNGKARLQASKGHIDGQVCDLLGSHFDAPADLDRGDPLRARAGHGIEGRAESQLEELTRIRLPVECEVLEMDAPWIPDRSPVDARGMVESEYLWAALDCVAAFTVTPENKEVAIVLGEQCTSILGDLMAGEKCVVIGWPLNVEGRKRYSASAIYAPNGRLVAIARLIFIEVPATTWAYLKT